MTPRSLLATVFLATISWYSNSVLAAVPPVDIVGKPALMVCPTTVNTPQIFHFDKVIFIITGKLLAQDPADQPALDALVDKNLNTELDIKIIDNPRTVANLKFKVLHFLGAAKTLDNSAVIHITDVEYASVVCPKMP